VGNSCRETPSLADGSSTQAAFKVNPKRKAAGKKVTLKFTATATNAETIKEKASLKVKKR